MKFSKAILKLYAVSNSSLFKNDDEFYKAIEESILGGVTCIQLREKNSSYSKFLERAKIIRSITQKYNIPLIINDNINIAIKVQADGVHLGQSDLSTLDDLPENLILGITVKNIEQAKTAKKLGADYIGAGAVFPTSTKLDATLISHKVLNDIYTETSLPIVAIGGITLENIGELKGNFISGVALSSGIYNSLSIKNQCDLFTKRLSTIFTKYKGFIFDLDGTLLDSMGMWSRLAEDFLISMNITPEPNLSQKFKTMTTSQSASYYREVYNINGTDEEIKKMVLSYVADYFSNKVKIIDGVVPMLEELSAQDIKMCIATATDRSLVNLSLAHTGLNKYFDTIFTCEEVGEGKSSPAIYKAALSSLGLNKNEVIVFEDAPHAIKTAKSDGFTVASISADSSRLNKKNYELGNYHIDSYKNWRIIND